MKKQILKFSILLISASLVFTACKKDKDADPVDDGSAVMQSGDEAAVNEESDQLADDGSSAIESGSSVGRVAKFGLCGADSVVFSDSKTATIYYNNTASCDGKRYRTGTINVALTAGTNWSDMNAELTMTIGTGGLKITRITDGKSIVINGTHSIKNVNSGKVKDLLSTDGTVTHEITASGMSVTFDNGTARTWDAKRRRTISRVDGVNSVKIEGIMDNAGLAATGTTRNGSTFTTVISTSNPLVAKICNANPAKPFWNLVSGSKTHSVNSKTITATYGFLADKSTTTDACTANTIKVDYEGPKGSLTVYKTYR